MGLIERFKKLSVVATEVYVLCWLGIALTISAALWCCYGVRVCGQVARLSPRIVASSRDHSEDHDSKLLRCNLKTAVLDPSGYKLHRVDALVRAGLCVELPKSC
jgi:hypothetical protein